MRGTEANVPPNKEAPMKKLVMTLTVLAFMSGSAMAAAPAAGGRGHADEPGPRDPAGPVAHHHGGIIAAPIRGRKRAPVRGCAAPGTRRRIAGCPLRYQ